MRALYEEAAAAVGAELMDGVDFADLESGELDGGFLCGLPYVGMERLEPLVAPAMGGGGPIYYSDVVARDGEQATSIEGFTGRRLAVNEPGSYSGWTIVLATLARRGVPVGEFAEVLPTGSHAGSLEAVAAGEADVAAVDSQLLTALAPNGLTIVERLGPSPSQPLAVGPSVEAAERERIRATLAGLSPGELDVTWIPVADSDYDPIREARDAAAQRGGF
jgi:ABC-type phosphate/phosphonate transport system substrate-binding protein